MALEQRVQLPAANTAIYLGIFASAFVGLALLLLVLGELGEGGSSTLLSLALAPVAVYLLIGFMARAHAPEDFFVAGRSIPAIYQGLAATVATLGGVGTVALTGAFFFLGFDALPFSIGLMLGLLAASILVAPYVRKDGSYTLASYLGRRFDSRPLRAMLGVAMTVPALFILIAELKIGMALTSRALGVSELLVAGLGGVVVATVAGLGGVRSLTWAGAAQALIALLALITPAVILALLLTNLPLPQITYGTLADDVARLEASAGITARIVSKLAISQPGGDPELLMKPFMQPFGATGSYGFAALMLTVAFGVVSLPALGTRASACRSVFEVRRAMGWTVVLTAGVLLTLPALALFARYEILSGLAGRTSDQIPAWLGEAARMGLASFETQGGVIALDQLRFQRDGVLLLLPMASGLPPVLVMVALAGAIAAVLAAATAQTQALAALWVEDIVFAWSEIGSQPAMRLAAGRGAAVGAALLGTWLAASVSADPLALFTWALALAAASAFAPLVMCVWWKRINQWGAMAGLLVGFGTALFLLLLTLAGALPTVFERSGAFATVIAVPLATVTALVVSLLTPRPDRRMLELVRDIRVPSGETVYERELRLARIGKR